MIIRFLFFLLILVACQEKHQHVAVPNPLIEETEMQEILKEMILLESHIQPKHPDYQDALAEMHLSGDAVLKKHGIDKTVFEKNMEYYSANQELLQQMYTNILEELNRPDVRVKD